MNLINIIDIYNKYHLPENLQMHMLRVAPDGVVDLKTRLEDAKERLFDLSFIDDVMELDSVWLRKEIIKKARNITKV